MNKLLTLNTTPHYKSYKLKITETVIQAGEQSEIQTFVVEETSVSEDEPSPVPLLHPTAGL